jgi:hypothetical protein
VRGVALAAACGVALLVIVLVAVRLAGAPSPRTGGPGAPPRAAVTPEGAPVTSDPGRRVAPPTLPPRQPEAPIAGLTPSERERAIADRIAAVLAAYPDFASLSSVACRADDCRIELLAPDLAAAAPVLERLQEPEAGLPALGAALILQTPVQVEGGWRISLRLTGAPADAGPPPP